MKHRLQFAIYVSVVLFVSACASAALDTAEIDKVIKKQVLEQQDLATIDSFVASAIKDMLAARDFGSIGNLRNEIVARAHSTQSSADIQYYPQFISSVAKNLDSAVDEAGKIADPNIRSNVLLNLLILLDNLNSPRLADIALKEISNENVSVRYWAVHALTNAGIVEQFNSGKAPASSAKTLVEKLGQRIGAESSPYILAQIAQFGATLNLPQAHELLFQIADVRIKNYQTWNADYVIVDGTILKLLADQMTGPYKADAGWRFGQLFAYVLELYAKSRGLVNDYVRDQLASVLEQTEGDALTKLGIPQSDIRKAIAKKDDAALMTEYKDLFGEGTAPGKFTTTFSVTYPAPDGSKRQTPLPLPEKPKS